MKHLRITSLLLFCALSIRTQAQSTLYVSPKGTGNSFTARSPGSLDKINEKLQSIPKDKTGETRILLKGGTYQLTNTLRITAPGESPETHRFTFSSVPGERALLSGGQQVTGWTFAGNGIYKAALPKGSAFRQLYINGKMAVRARTPNRDHAEEYGPYHHIKRFDEKAKTVLIMAGELPAVKKINEVEIVANQHWYQSRLRIGSVTVTKDTAAITVQEPERKILFGMTGNKMLWPDKPYYLENALEFLDADNEWYFDEETSVLYYKPAAGKKIETLDVTFPRIETLLQVSGTEGQPLHHVTFRDIDFAYSNWLTPSAKGSILTQGAQYRGMDDLLPGLIQVEFVRNFQLTGCSVSAAGANGVVFSRGVWDSGITGNHIHDISANALVIDTYKKANPAETLQCRNDVIAQNLVEHVGLQYTNGMGLIASCVSGLIVEHNEIRYGRYSGMQIGNHYGDKASGTDNNLVRFNNIHHVMLLHDDGGAIYTLANQKGTRIYGNWIHDYTKCQWADNYPVNGVFLDNNSAYIEVKDNVFTNLPNVDQLKENKGTKIHDNVFINNESQDEAIKAAAGITAKPVKKKK